MSGAPTGELVDRVAEAVRSVPGVVDLHGGALGEAVTLLPGRRVAGIRQSDDDTEVHISVEHGSRIREVADAVRQSVRAVTGSAVTVVVEDVVVPDEDPAADLPS
ncbi:Asp23/Gls24 family envelope stress response protein [Phycicoccus sp. HDW14]|uniref:Asp23/Gls24 family envelope stress response protein n=1 Tax=Phycicoccus sp. HDW14 TaxID=2714941 RepID=UPI00140D483A|nr:Asp23/Gls24 family envelope stress response protein [Phycicoccus sp. HDW14]QIM22343.1 Asp23/Gls24 family envelope stress response protein [Phycicoccus sp. HDW14]